MKKLLLTSCFALLIIFTTIEQPSYGAYPFPNVTWFYKDMVYVEQQTHWNMTRCYDNRYWVIDLFNLDKFYYYYLDILIISNITIDVFLFGKGAASNEIKIPEGTRIGIQQFSFQYLLKSHTEYRDWCVYLYLDNSDDDGRGVPYTGNASVSVDINITQAIVPIISEYLYVYIPFTILMTTFLGAIYYINKKRKLFESINSSQNNTKKKSLS
jgi:hypothetical protein